MVSKVASTPGVGSLSRSYPLLTTEFTLRDFMGTESASERTYVASFRTFRKPSASCSRVLEMS